MQFTMIATLKNIYILHSCFALKMLYLICYFINLNQYLSYIVASILSWYGA